MVTVYWHCLGMTENDERFVAGALDELAQHLKDDPIKLPVNIKALTDELAKEVDERLNRLSNQSYTFNNCAADIGYLFLKFDLTTETCLAKLLVYCPDGCDRAHPLARRIANAASREKPSALYGATCGSFAAIYRRGYKVTIWHEALHLLGADDCYIVENRRVRKKSCCKLDGCIMEYNPPESTCEKWPFLCDRNVKKLSNDAEPKTIPECT